MPLPILSIPNEPSPADLLRHYLRCELHWVRHVAEDETILDVGAALTNPAIPAVHDANHMRDVTAPPGMAPPDVVKMIDDHFAAQGVRCAYYVLNPSTPQEQNADLVDHLLSLGFERSTRDVYSLAKFPGVASRSIPDIKIIPSRASYRHFNELAAENAAEVNAPQLAEAWPMHLDDPHYDAILALQNGKAIAHGGVLAIGEMGFFANLYVTRDRRHQGLGTLIVSRLMEICARSLFKSVYLDISDCNDLAAPTLYQKFGFRKVTQSPIYRAPWTKDRHC
jgi:GNAT superfamily N-acetyltransferase